MTEGREELPQPQGAGPISPDDAMERLSSLKAAIEARGTGDLMAMARATYPGIWWLGAGVVVSSPDPGILEAARARGDICVQTRHARVVGGTFRAIQGIVARTEAYGHVSKLEFWGSVGERVAGAALQPGSTEAGLASEAIEAAREVIRNWRDASARLDLRPSDDPAPKWDN